MKRVAILVIAATNQPVYQHYITAYWTELIRHVRAEAAHIDVYLLTEHGQTNKWYANIADAVIEDPDPNVERLVPAAFRTPNTPGILSKTVHALDLLAGDYDVFFRTNLSSVVKLSSFDQHVQATPDLGYSGGLVWNDALRDNLTNYNWIGPGRPVTDLSELDRYPGNSFVSGSGFFLSADEAQHLVDQRDRLRFDLPDDVAIGLMFERASMLTGFTAVFSPQSSIGDMLQRFESTTAQHLRLTHFPIERAMALWRYVDAAQLWR